VSRCVQMKNHSNKCNQKPRKFRPHPCLPHVPGQVRRPSRSIFVVVAQIEHTHTHTHTHVLGGVIIVLVANTEVDYVTVKSRPILIGEHIF
jgi:hypothetical protein